MKYEIEDRRGEEPKPTLLRDLEVGEAFTRIGWDGWPCIVLAIGDDKIKYVGFPPCLSDEAVYTLCKNTSLVVKRIKLTLVIDHV